MIVFLVYFYVFVMGLTKEITLFVGMSPYEIYLDNMMN